VSNLIDKIKVTRGSKTLRIWNINPRGLRWKIIRLKLFLLRKLGLYKEPDILYFDEPITIYPGQKLKIEYSGSKNNEKLTLIGRVIENSEGQKFSQIYGVEKDKK